MNSIPVLFDTDIGSDIDDAVALAYLLCQPACELVGITTVTGDTQKRAALAETVCRAGGRTDIPLHAGLAGPLLWGPGQPHVPQYDAVQSEPHRLDHPSDAVGFLRDTIRARPGEITLLGVGPLTNIAALFTAYPDTIGLLKNIVLMCGVFTSVAGHGPGEREWNALVDPVATGLVYKAAGSKLLSVGLDVTMQVSLPREEVETRFSAAGGSLGMVGAMAQVWFRHTARIVFHDPLAAALLWEPGLCGYTRGTVTVTSVEGPHAGMTRFQAKDDGPDTIATSVDADAFFRHYFGTTGGA